MIERRSNRRARNGRKTPKNVLFVFQNCTFRFADYKYDKAIADIFPERTYFFPARNNSFHDNSWLSDNFRKIWKNVSPCHAVPYALRHHYATTNINNWINRGMDFNSKLLYLSKSMGHSVIESTAYYYSLVPGLSDIIEERTQESFDNIVPDLTDVNHEETE